LIRLRKLKNDRSKIFYGDKSNKNMKTLKNKELKKVKRQMNNKMWDQMSVPIDMRVRDKAWVYVISYICFEIWDMIKSGLYEHMGRRIGG
jgi:homospermidine synthase